MSRYRTEPTISWGTIIVWAVIALLIIGVIVFLAFWHRVPPGTVGRICSPIRSPSRA
ncbi:MAG: hypothetical protein UX13_C0039G0007 [Candidatus Woesebacteria bacterium GW2011_GWB1_45_5]|uniref:Uncharacterized protein n=1 Tax=Candidatus Woesebacteria bacterium GW2011_GWB1_45_5 TaxID=1618581 RepID=A0A0G1MMY9_9BACT|nr:MAG: hypothetical protein UX13_C0039G0007 [Candidatus Woesebacteria bacterium GW2011_GWB1_45_5]